MDFSIYAARCRGRWPVAVSWFAGEGYIDHADRLMESLIGYDLNFLVLTSPLAPGGWERNCNRKPAAVLAAVDLLRRDVMWLDADAEVVDWRGFPEPTHDLLVMRPRGRWPGVNSSLMSGTVYFRYTALARATVTVWKDACERNPDRLDQESLASVVADAESKFGLRVGDLDPRFICVRDLMPDVKDPYVVHHQASRTAECRFTKEVR